MAIALNKGWTPGQEWKGFDWQNPGGAATDPTAYSATPLPQSGNGPFGNVPGSLGIPNPAADLATQVPGLSERGDHPAHDDHAECREALFLTIDSLEMSSMLPKIGGVEDLKTTIGPFQRSVARKQLALRSRLKLRVRTH